MAHMGLCCYLEVAFFGVCLPYISTLSHFLCVFVSVTLVGLCTYSVMCFLHRQLRVQ